MSILSELPEPMFTMILPAYTNQYMRRRCRRKEVNMKKERKKPDGAAQTAVKAYAEKDLRFDPYGSYTGKSTDGKPCQDADDL